MHYIGAQLGLYTREMGEISFVKPIIKARSLQPSFTCASHTMLLQFDRHISREP